MTEPVLLVDKKFNGRVWVMTLNRPEAMNALNIELTNKIAETWEAFAADEGAWVAVVTGKGDRAFCAGQDLVERSNLETGAQAKGEVYRPDPRRRRTVYPLCETLNMWKPTIAAINGYAIAGGWNLAQQCDIRIAAEQAEVGIAEVRWNQGAGWVHTLPRQLHLAHALEIVLWGDRRITAQRAYEIGWVNRVVPKEKLMDEAMEWAERMLYLAPRSVRNLKEILYRGFHMEPMTARSFAATLERNLQGMHDSVEGPLAFKEKRKPAFTGT
ncbi:MAG: enoyl-CoA hydratase/isomerase family protein [Chloroflexi bacterium]|nr:enoyl-CoA hydratase/isomerase family protein [Chloroflexota bacterium]